MQVTYRLSEAYCMVAMVMNNKPFLLMSTETEPYRCLLPLNLNTLYFCSPLFIHELLVEPVQTERPFNDLQVFRVVEWISVKYRFLPSAPAEDALSFLQHFTYYLDDAQIGSRILFHEPTTYCEIGPLIGKLTLPVCPMGKSTRSFDILRKRERLQEVTNLLDMWAEPTPVTVRDMAQNWPENLRNKTFILHRWRDLPRLKDFFSPDSGLPNYFPEGVKLNNPSEWLPALQKISPRSPALVYECKTFLEKYPHLEENIHFPLLVSWIRNLANFYRRGHNEVDMSCVFTDRFQDLRASFHERLVTFAPDCFLTTDPHTVMVAKNMKSAFWYQQIGTIIREIPNSSCRVLTEEEASSRVVTFRVIFHTLVNLFREFPTSCCVIFHTDREVELFIQDHEAEWKQERVGINFREVVFPYSKVVAQNLSKAPTEPDGIAFRDRLQHVIVPTIHSYNTQQLAILLNYLTNLNATFNTFMCLGCPTVLPYRGEGAPARGILLRSTYRCPELDRVWLKLNFEFSWASPGQGVGSLAWDRPHEDISQPCFLSAQNLNEWRGDEMLTYLINQCYWKGASDLDRKIHVALEQPSAKPLSSPIDYFIRRFRPMDRISRRSHLVF